MIHWYNRGFNEVVISKLLTEYAYSLWFSDKKITSLSAFTPFAEKTWLETTFRDEEGNKISEAGDCWTCVIKLHHQIMGKRMI